MERGARREAASHGDHAARESAPTLQPARGWCAAGCIRAVRVRSGDNSMRGGLLAPLLALGLWAAASADKIPIGQCSLALEFLTFPFEDDCGVLASGDVYLDQGHATRDRVSEFLIL
jgi:hypothetical protein